MTSSIPSVDPPSVGVATDDDNLTVELADGRRVIVPLAWLRRPQLFSLTFDVRIHAFVRNGKT